MLIPSAPKTAVVAIGGNSLIQDNKKPQVEFQWEAVRETCEHLARMIEAGWRLVITHGNGPQVGFILRRAELAAAEVHGVPLDIIVADTQGSIGYMLQQALRNSLLKLGIHKQTMSVVTQTLVAGDDPAFQNPDKPIGAFTTEADARTFEAQGWRVVEDSGRGWRRVVASPKPLEIIELSTIQLALANDYVVVAVGGGGIPVIRKPDGELRGVYAVIDKDRASALLAAHLQADLFLISTGVEQVSLNFNKPNQRFLSTVNVNEAKRYMREGHFGAGSMLPKIEAVVSFIEQGGREALITDFANLERALRGETGTRVVPDAGTLGI